jgi:hypothetical protein
MICSLGPYAAGVEISARAVTRMSERSSRTSNARRGLGAPFLDDHAIGGEVGRLEQNGFPVPLALGRVEVLAEVQVPSRDVDHRGDRTATLAAMWRLGVLKARVGFPVGVAHDHGRAHDGAEDDVGRIVARWVLR